MDVDGARPKAKGTSLLFYMTRNILCAGGGQSNYDNVEDVREITML